MAGFGFFWFLSVIVSQYSCSLLTAIIVLSVQMFNLQKKKVTTISWHDHVWVSCKYYMLRTSNLVDCTYQTSPASPRLHGKKKHVYQIVPIFSAKYPYIRAKQEKNIGQQEPFDPITTLHLHGQHGTPTLNLHCWGSILAAGSFLGSSWGYPNSSLDGGRQGKSPSKMEKWGRPSQRKLPSKMALKWWYPKSSKKSECFFVWKQPGGLGDPILWESPKWGWSNSSIHFASHLS